MNISKRVGPHLLASERGMVLVGTRIGGQKPQFPPTEYLVDGDDATDIALGPTGRLYSYSIVHPGKDKAPYALAMADFGDVRAFGRLVFEGTAPAIDSVVRVVPFTLADGEQDYAFEGVAS